MGLRVPGGSSHTVPYTPMAWILPGFHIGIVPYSPVAFHRIAAIFADIRFLEYV